MRSVYVDEAFLDAAGQSEFPELYAYIHERELQPIVDGIANQIIVRLQYLQNYIKDYDDKLCVQPPPPTSITPISVATEISFTSFAGILQINGIDTPDVVVNQGFGYYPMDLCDFSGTFPQYTVTDMSRDQLLALAYTSYDLDAFKNYIIDDTVNMEVMFIMHLRQKRLMESKQYLLNMSESVDPKRTLLFPIMILYDFNTDPNQDIPSAYLTIGDTDNPVRWHIHISSELNSDTFVNYYISGCYFV
ncbi:MAG: hypothetical protein EZS28_016403 [Streblomastix strix]|uniref:Uncharacterized protein n=1 Tax=Streblomastix strix TaxID=222440 RepID=A0A5J4W0N2_9EUKA|nr:MAG: hypothetical protein EZS28_016403 [Streblomastix strix]